MRHVSIDLETFSTQSNAVIISIGAAQFHPFTGEIEREFYTVINPDSAIRYGAHVEGGTVMWWLRQDEDARKAVQHGGELAAELVHLSDWLTDLPELPDHDIAVYGNGAKFDLTILENSYRMAGLQLPWSYKNEFCGRTLRGLATLTGNNLLSRPSSPTVGTKHNALDDAKWLAGEIAYALNTVKEAVGYYECGPVFNGSN